MFAFKWSAKIFYIVSLLVLVNLIWFVYDPKAIRLRRYSDSLNNGIKSAIRLHKRDWHNNDLLASSLNRSGPGENGAPVLFSEYTKALYERYGFEAVLSDLISLNRSLPDARPDDCRTMTYISELPKSALIITFYNERLSTLLRTVYSIVTRTPVELIEEIILVDDGSTWSDLQVPLDEFLQRNLPPESSKVRLLRLPQRSGLMVARMTGARNVSQASEVFIFLDSHFEMMYNWLPPLLEPIVLNPKACTIPSLDKIAFDTFQYKFDGELRGYFDWFMNFQIRALHQDELAHPARNFRAYVMMGGALAIRADFFWHLGGFDEGMVFWGGEQYELSFKVWMCGGELINVPCSRMGHLFRDPDTSGNTNLYADYEFMDKNIRRLIDVWFDDEHRQYVLNHRPSAVAVDPGDLTARIALRDSLQCLSFSWMLDHIMPDLKTVFPPVEPPNHGNGTIRHFMNPEICIVLESERKEIVLRKCDIKDWHHSWIYSWRCELRSDSICMEADANNGHVNAYHCHIAGGNQKWFYDAKMHWIVHSDTQMCMLPNAGRTKLDLAPCDIKNSNMKWSLASYNETAIIECLITRTER